MTPIAGPAARDRVAVAAGAGLGAGGAGLVLAAARLAAGKAFADAAGVARMAETLGVLLVVAGIATAARSRAAAPEAGRGSRTAVVAALALAGLGWVGVPGLLGVIGRGHGFCDAGPTAAVAVLTGAPALVGAAVLHVVEVVRPRRLAAATGVLAAAALPPAVFLLARLSDRVTCGT